MSSVSAHAFCILWLVLVMCPLLFPFPPQVLAADQAAPAWAHSSFAGTSPAIEVLGQEAPASVPNEVPSPFGAKAGEPNRGLDQERRAVFDFDAPNAGRLLETSKLFEASRWILLSDRFGFLPSPAFLNEAVLTGPSGKAVAVPQLRTRTFTLVGRLSPVGPSGTQILELHGAHEGPTGSLFTLDGFVRNETAGLVLDAVYSIGLRGSEHFGHVRLHLEPRPAAPADQSQTVRPVAPGSPPAFDPGRSPERPGSVEDLLRESREFRAHQYRMLAQGGNDAFFRSLVENHRFADGPPKLDPVLFTEDEPEYIEGIPVPSWFDVELTGKVDGISFDDPLQAMLMLSESEQPGQAVSVLLSAKGYPDGSLGTIAGSTSMDTGWEVHAAHGALSVKLHNPPTGLAHSLRWTTVLNGAPTMALPTRVDATLSIDGARLEGHLEAEGYVALDSTRTSRYSARLSGALHENKAMKQVLARVGVLPLTGDWQTGTDALGVIHLKHTGNARTGTFGPEGTGVIDGRIADGILTLAWTEADGRSGWGFLRSLSGAGRALGMWGAGPDRTAAVPILATQPMEPWNERDAARLSDEEVDLLRKLGRDFAGQGKCAQALSVLDLVWDGYGKRLENQAGRPEVEIFGVLVEMNTIIQPMIECAFDLGLYDKTLAYLREALALKREMNPLTRARHAFTSQVARTGAELRKMAGTISLLLDNLEPLRLPKVGMMFDPKAPNQPLIIGAIGSGSPAALAGLKPGDEVLLIDGEAARPLDTEGALRALRGAEGTPLKLTVSTAGKPREVVVVRAPWHYGVPSAERRAQLEQAMESLRLSAEETRSVLLTLADAVEQAAPPAKANDSEFDAAFQRLIDLIEEEKARVPQRVQPLIALGESLFGGWDRYMPTQRFLLHAFAEMTGETEQVPFAERPTTIDAQRPVGVVEDEMIAELFADPAINGAEASLFYEHFKAVILTLGLTTQLKTSTQAIHKWKRLAKPGPEAIQEHARSIAQLSQSLERWRARLALDQTKIAALNAGAPFAREWLKVLWDLEPKTEGTAEGGAMEVLVAAESVRNRAMQDLLAGREEAALARQGGAENALVSFHTQVPLTVDELVELVRARGSTTVTYYVLDDRLLAWVLDAAKLSCTWETKPVMEERASGDDPYYDVLQRLQSVAEGQSLQDNLKSKSYRCLGIEVRELRVSAEELKTFAWDFQSFVSRKSIQKSDGSAQAFARLLHDLHQRLVAPIAHLLPTDPEAVVTIIPDAELFQIPFGALITTPVNDLARVRHLIEDHPLVYLTSIGMMRFTQENARRAAEAARGGFVTFWDPVGIEYSGLEPFFETEQKRVQAIWYLKAHYPADIQQHIFIGSEATPENVFATAPQARVLTFVTHAEASETPGDDRESYIALAGARLPLTEIYGLDLHADIAILAGCETGRGRIGADGVIGLSRAFTFAGAPTLAMSLWKIPERDTVLMLDRFYHAYLDEGKPKAHALRQAQIEAISEFASEPQPNLWAGMVLFGEP